MKRSTKAVAAIALAGGLLLSSACGTDKMTEGFKDAQRGSVNDSPADTVTFPDGFSNIATKCDHGNRIYSTFHGDNPYAAIAVVPDAKDC